ncbi:hypothetical protein AB1462_26635 [Pseudomonas sp. SB113]|uniref:hypothetical protein n=1 Tax=Pseudomonas sp. SB113 TaxID=3154123 RepID=UPI00345D7D11
MKIPGGKRRRPIRRNASGLADLEIPVLDYVEPPILHGYVPHEHLATDLVVVISELWPDSAQDPSAFDILTLHWNRDGGQGVPPYRQRLDGPIRLEFPFQITISRDYLVDGRVELFYSIEDHTGTLSPSEVRILHLDTLPPNNNVAPPAPGLPTGLINESYLSMHSTVDIVLSAYNGRRGFDRAYYYVSESSPPPDSAADGYVDFPFEDTPLIVPIPGVMFRKFPNGIQYVHIRLEDRSGNRGPRSDQASVVVDLIPSPIGLKAPVIEAMRDGLINLNDARLGVTVRVSYDHWEVNDFIHLRWGKTLITPHRVSQSTSTITIPWNVLIAYGEGPGSDFAVYHVTRGPEGAPSPPSPGTLYRWNFTTAGDPNPEAPALLNRTYHKATLFGEGSQTENYIDLRDKDKRIYAHVPLYNSPLAGELLELYLGEFPDTSKPVASYVVNTADGDTGDKVIEFTDIPWAVFEALGNHDKLAVFYTTYNGVNEQLANFSEAILDVAPPVTLLNVEFPSANLGNFLNCTSEPRIWDYIPLKVPHHALMEAGDKLILSWHGYEEFAGTRPIAGTGDVLERVLSLEDASRGYVFQQDKYDEKVKPIRSPDPHSLGSSASAEYTLMRGTRVLGRSRIRYVKIDRRRGEVWCGPDGDGPDK